MPAKPITSEQAKAMVEGQLGWELEKYPLKFATSAFFGTRPQPGTPASVNSGSASLFRFNGQSFALTCSHVLDGYRERLEEGQEIIFQLGNCVLDPLSQLKAEDEKLDYALIALTDNQVNALVKSQGPFDGTFFVEPQWPPAVVTEGEFVAFGGFPGELRQAKSFDALSFGSYSSGAAEVTLVRDDYLVCQFDRNQWVKHGFEPEPSTIRGMSGGPAFVIRHSAESGIITHEFVGHVYEFSESYELLYIRLAAVLPL